MSMYLLLDAFWFVWFVWVLKYVLFWLYLWQLKDYHIGRFVDHFRTHKGRQAILNFRNFFKLILLILLLSFDGIFAYLFVILFLLYIAETLIFLRAISRKSVKKPKITLKTIFLAVVSFAVVIIFLEK